MYTNFYKNNNRERGGERERGEREREMYMGKPTLRRINESHSYPEKKGIIPNLRHWNLIGFATFLSVS